MGIINTKITTPVQLIAFLIQVINANVPMFGQKVQLYLLIAVAGLQSVMAILQAFKNPDGSPAQVPWNPVNPPIGNNLPRN